MPDLTTASPARKPRRNGKPESPPAMEQVTTIRKEFRPVGEGEAPEPQKEKIECREWMNSLSMDDRKEFRIYFYRMPKDQPETRKASGSYLSRLSEEEDNPEYKISQFLPGDFYEQVIGWVRKHHGGSRYRMYVNFIHGGGTKYIEPLDIEGPMIATGQETELEGAVKAAQMGDKSRLEGFFMDLVEKRLGPELLSQKVNPNQAVSEMMGTINAMVDSMDKLKGFQKPDAPAPATSPFEMANFIVGVMDKADHKFDAWLERMDKMGMLPKASNPGTAIVPAADPFEQFTRMVDKLKTFGIPINIGANAITEGGSAPNTTVEVLRAVREILPEVKPILAGLAARWMAPAPMRPNVAVIPSAATSARPNSPQPAAPGNGRPPASGAASAQAVAPQPEAPRQITPEEAQSVYFSTICLRILEMFNGGRDGHEIAAFVCDAVPAYGNMLGALDEPTLIAQIKANELLAPMAVGPGGADHPRLKPFIAEFLDYFKPQPEGPET